MNNIIINPKYNYLKTFIENLPQTFDTLGTVVYKSRNIIRRVEYGDLVLNIKSYKKPIFINRIAYSFFRKSKAKRAYEYAVRLTNSGFATPDSVAYMEYFNSRLLNNSYFVSIHNDEAKIFRDYQYQNLTEELTIMLQQMAEYIAKLHDNNIIHLDFSPGNILIEKVGDKYIFSLIDINRMGFKKVSTDEGMMNFGRLCVPDDKVAVIAKYYAKARNIDEDFCMQTMYKNNRKNIKKFTIGKNRKQKILAFFGKK